MNSTYTSNIIDFVFQSVIRNNQLPHQILLRGKKTIELLHNVFFPAKEMDNLEVAQLFPFSITLDNE